MIEENKFGFRDKRGHFVPKEPANKNPLWVLPFDIKKILVTLWPHSHTHFLNL